MSVTGLESVTYGVEDMEKAKNFWADFGLTQNNDFENGALFTAQNGAEIIVKPIDDASLPPPVSDGSTVRETTFGVTSAEALSTIANEVSKDRDVVENDDGSIHFIDPVGLGLAFRVRTTTKVVAPELEFNVPGRPARVNRRGKKYDSAKPMEMSHIVFMVNDLEAQRQFYADRLGFVITDGYPGRGHFLRGADARNHHNLFFLNPANKTGFHHLAFEVSDIHEIFGGGLNMTRKGWQTMLGPGRHPISSCYFWYFHNPCGGAAEYDFDSDVIDENWKAGEFESSPEMFAEWCLAEGMGEKLLFKGIQSADHVSSS